ncbi:hypothetical protein [Streptomyces sp. NPDC095602]|uniref:hypothetical protein n=1 Tax=Streptomyces sp. NPDC095602 TaxID=3155819 RepID=UPI0033340BF3
MPDFPQDTVPVRVECAFGADLTADPSTWTWTDLSSRIHSQTISISQGAQNEGSEATPASCSLQLDNSDGHLTPDHPLSPYWPDIDIGVPCRLTVRGGETVLRLDGATGSTATTPDHASLTITGDIDVRAEVDLDWYHPTANQGILGRWNPSGNQRGWMLRVYQQHAQFHWTSDGTMATQRGIAAPLPALPRRAALRATLDIDNGAGGHTVTLYWAPSLDGPWQVIASATDTGTTSIHASTAPLTIAPSAADTTPPRRPMTGTGYRFQVRSGINGTVVATPDVRALADGAGQFTDAAGRLWTVNGGAAITTWHYRMVGHVDDWRPTWPYGDLSNRERGYQGEARVNITASGPLRRMRQGQKALESTLRRRINPTAEPRLLAYWPMEDSRGASRCFSPMEGVLPLRFTGLELAAADTLGGSAALPTVGTPATIRATVPATTVSGWQTEFVYRLPKLPTDETQIIRVLVTGSVCRYATVYASTAGIKIEARNNEGDVVAFFRVTDADAIADFWGRWNRLALYVADAGGGQTRLIARWYAIDNTSERYASTIFTGTMGRAELVTGDYLAATEGLALGHLSVIAAAGSGTLPGSRIYDGADDGFTGETAGARLQRLSAEEGVPVRLLGPPSSTMRMGPQRPAALLDLFAECAATDGGILTEQRDGYGLEYRPRASLYNQTPALLLDASANEISNPFDPVRDDQAVRNDVEVKREGGSAGRYVDEESVARMGRRDEQIQINAYSDDILARMAQWRVHVGTWPGTRYPSITTDLATAPHLIPTWLPIRAGDRLQVTGLPPQHPAALVDVLIQGYSESLTPTGWTITATCRPAGPWTVGVLGDPELGRADTGGCQLSSALDTVQTTVSVVTTRGPRWIDSATYPGAFPFLITVGGEVMRVTACTGTGTAQSFTVERGVTGAVKAHPDAAPVRLATPFIIAL